MFRISYQLFPSSNKTNQVFKNLRSCTISLNRQIRPLFLPKRLTKRRIQTGFGMSGIIKLLIWIRGSPADLTTCIKNLLTYCSLNIDSGYNSIQIRMIFSRTRFGSRGDSVFDVSACQELLCSPKLFFSGQEDLSVSSEVDRCGSSNGSGRISSVQIDPADSG